MRLNWRELQCRLPQHLRRALLQGSVGRLHLADMAENALSLAAGESGEKQHIFLSLGMDMLLAGFEADCLDYNLGVQLKSLNEKSSFLPAPFLPIIDWLLANYAPPADQRYFYRLLEERDTEKMCHYLADQIRKDPKNAYWLNQAMMVGSVEARLDWLEEMLGMTSGVPGILFAVLKGNIAFARKDYAKAAGLYAQATDALNLTRWRARQAHSLYKVGEKELAVSLGLGSLNRRPWQTNEILYLYDIASGLAEAKTAPEGKGAVLFYTWNKAADIDLALKAVFTSELCGAEVIVLDNGSTDNTGGVLKAWRDKIGHKHMRIVSLPINVGAPAARNWLASLPEVRSCDWFAYIDDDAVVPQDWLLRLGAAMAAYPDAGVYGCKVVDAHNPNLIQSVDLHMNAGIMGMDMDSDLDRNFQISSLQIQDFDYGQFNYIRPTLSVTGCCHLFKRALFDKVGGFDLRYSPSQYDDLEHDIRRAIQGALPVYQGHLDVLHAKQTGKSARQSKSQYSNAMGNLMKLQNRYSIDEFEAARRFDEAAALDDILRKEAALEEEFPQ